MNKPGYTVIETTAAEFAATFFEAARNTGMTSKKHKNARSYAKANFEMYIPKAIEILTDMLGREDVSIHLKDEISNALIERANDRGAHAIANTSIRRPFEYHLPPEFKGDKGEGVIKPEVLKAKVNDNKEKIIDRNPTVLHNRPPLILKG